MNWEIVGAVAEMLGALGVIASLESVCIMAVRTKSVVSRVTKSRARISLLRRCMVVLKYWLILLSTLY